MNVRKFLGTIAAHMLVRPVRATRRAAAEVPREFSGNYPDFGAAAAAAIGYDSDTFEWDVDWDRSSLAVVGSHSVGYLIETRRQP